MGTSSLYGFLGRAQYPLMGDESFTRGRWVPFIMAGPAVVWTTSDFKDLGGNKTSTNVGIVAELGAEFFVMSAAVHWAVLPLPSCLWANNDFEAGFSVSADAQLNQFMILGRLAWHF